MALIRYHDKIFLAVRVVPSKTPYPNFETPCLRPWKFLTQCRTEDRSQHLTKTIKIKMIQAFWNVTPCPLVMCVPIYKTHNPIGSSPCEEFKYRVIVTTWQSKKVWISILQSYERLISRFVFSRLTPRQHEISHGPCYSAGLLILPGFCCYYNWLFILFLQSHTSALTLSTSIFAKHNTIRLLSSLSRVTPPIPFPIVSGRTTKGLYFRWLINSKILKVSLNFRGRKTPTSQTKVANSSPK